MSTALHLGSGNVSGYVICDGKCIPRPGASARVALPHYSSPGSGQLFHSANVLSKSFPVYGARSFLVCQASSNSHRRNQDFSRQNKGISKGRGRQFQGQDNSQHIEDDILSSKNGPLISLSSNQRFQATATPGKREKEIVELFRKVQAQLRERAAIKEEKKIEAAQQGQTEKGTVDSLLKLLRKHSVDQGRKGSEEEDYNDQPDSSSPFEDERVPNLFDSNNINEEVNLPEPAPNSRPASNFRRRSPVPRVKFQPVFSADEDDNSIPPLKSQGKKKSGIDIPDRSGATSQVLDSVSHVEPNGVSLDVPSYSSDIDETSEETTDLRSSRLSESRGRGPAKSQGVKGILKVKKSSGTADQIDLDSVPFVEPDELSLAVPSYSSDTDEIPDEVAESTVLEPTNLNSLKLSELRDLAKSRGVKGYSKLKKSDLVELLNGDDA